MEHRKGPDSRFGLRRGRRRRRILTWVGAVALILLLVIVAIGIWVARALPGIAAAEIGRLTSTRAEMGTFDFHRDGSVSIDGLVIRPQRGQLFYDDTILRAKAVRARFSLGSLLMLAPRVTEIHIEDFIFDVQFDLDTQQWNVGDLRIRAPRGGSVGEMPAITLHQGRLRYCKASGGKTEVVMSVPVEARFGFGEGLGRGYDFEIRTAGLSGGYGDSHLTGYWRPGQLAVAGPLSSTDIPSLERAWAVDVSAAQLEYDSDGSYTLDLRVHDLHSKHSPEVDTFRMFIPTEFEQAGPLATVQRFFARYRPFGTVGELTVKASGSFKSLNDSEVTGRIVCDNVSMCDRKFPYTISNLTGEVDFTRSTVTVSGLAGKHANVDLVIHGWTRGYGDERQYQYRVTSDNVVLDEALYAALQPQQKQLWNAFEPSGVVAVEYQLERTSPTDRRRAISVDLQQVSATYRKFPYPLEGLIGRLHFDSDSISASSIVSQVGSRRIAVNGEVRARRSDNPTYSISIDANNVPLDAALARALPEQHRRLYEQCDANGLADVRAKVFTSEDPNEMGSVSFLADVLVSAASLTPQSFPVTVTDVRADASITPDAMNLTTLTGRYERSPVTMTGAVQFSDGNTPQQLHFKIAATEAPLDDKTMALLPESLKQPVAAFHPQGAVNLTVDVQKADGNEPADYTVAVECLGNRIEHERFPYPLQDVRGTITVGPGHMAFEDIQATPVSVSGQESSGVVRMTGRLDRTKAGFAAGTITAMASAIPFTSELGAVLPPGLAGVYRDMAPQGVFDLDLESLRVSERADDERRVDFAGRVNLRDCKLRVSGAAARLRGGLRVDGTYGTKAGLAAGHMALDAEQLTVRGKDITALKADLAFDPNEQRWSARNFLGACYGGKILGNLELGPTADGVLRYLLQVAFNRVDLEPFLLAGKTGEAAQRSHTSGTMNAALSLGARIGDGASRLGICKVDVVDMQVGKVSPLANLISVLQLSEPTAYTFEQMLIDSYLRRNTLLIQKLDMSGKNVAFTGSGTMDIAGGEVDLTLTARGRRTATAEPSVLQSLTEGLGSAVVRMEVTGPADNPKVETKTLPVIEDTLKILGTPE